MNILCIGDIVGKPGRDAVAKILPELKKEFNVEMVVANAENSAGGFGTTPRIANDLFRLGCDVLTLGDHVWDKQEIAEYLSETKPIIRPANFPNGVPGHGFCIFETPSQNKVCVINLLGRVFMRYNINCPFRELEGILAKLNQDVKVIIVDIHAETTSEKVAMGFFGDGKVSAILGTHTHIQTADETILPKGTAYMTDLGMTGPYDSVIGQKKEKILERFLTGFPTRFEIAENDVRLSAAVVTIDEETGKARAITRIQRRL